MTTRQRAACGTNYVLVLGGAVALVWGVLWARRGTLFLADSAMESFASLDSSIHAIGPAAIGMVVGWMLYFFIRLYKLFSPRTLAATFGALAGGPVLSLLTNLTSSGDVPAALSLWYFLGVGAGFFAYAIWAGSLTILYLTGKIATLSKFRIALGCGAGIDDALDTVEHIMEFEELAGQWSSDKIGDNEFREMLPSVGLTRKEFLLARREGDLRVSADSLDRFARDGYLEFLRK